MDTLVLDKADNMYIGSGAHGFFRGFPELRKGFKRAVRDGFCDPDTDNDTLINEIIESDFNEDDFEGIKKKVETLLK